MADHFPGAKTPASSPVREPLYGAAADRIRDQLREPAQLTVAISVAEKILDTYSDTTGWDIYAYARACGGMGEALRILLRAVGADARRIPPATAGRPVPGSQADEALRRARQTGGAR